MATQGNNSISLCQSGIQIFSTRYFNILDETSKRNSSRIDGFKRRECKVEEDLPGELCNLLKIFFSSKGQGEIIKYSIPVFFDQIESHCP